MRRLVLFLVCCCISHAALAEDYPALFAFGRHELKSEYRRCTRDVDCTTVNEICARMLAVSKVAKLHVAAVIEEYANKKDFKCAEYHKEPAPEARCIKGFCS